MDRDNEINVIDLHTNQQSISHFCPVVDGLVTIEPDSVIAGFLRIIIKRATVKSHIY